MNMHVACVEKPRNAKTILVGKSEGKRQLARCSRK
jgi:hypothetical protein